MTTPQSKRRQKTRTADTEKAPKTEIKRLHQENQRLRAERMDLYKAKELWRTEDLDPCLEQLRGTRTVRDELKKQVEQLKRDVEWKDEEIERLREQGRRGVAPVEPDVHSEIGGAANPPPLESTPTTMTWQELPTPAFTTSYSGPVQVDSNGAMNGMAAQLATQIHWNDPCSSPAVAYNPQPFPGDGFAHATFQSAPSDPHPVQYRHRIPEGSNDRPTEKRTPRPLTSTLPPWLREVEEAARGIARDSGAPALTFGYR